LTGQLFLLSDPEDDDSDVFLIFGVEGLLLHVPVMEFIVVVVENGDGMLILCCEDVPILDTGCALLVLSLDIVAVLLPTEL